MRVDELRQRVAGYDGVLVLAPVEGDGTPPIAWGDVFFYYAPGGEVPTAQPFATVITKDYPDEPTWCRGSGCLRVNIAVGTRTFRSLLGREAGDPAQDDEPDPAAPDTVAAHPSYGSLGWVSVVDPGEQTTEVVLAQLEAAYDAARARAERRGDR